LLRGSPRLPWLEVRPNRSLPVSRDTCCHSVLAPKAHPFDDQPIISNHPQGFFVLTRFSAGGRDFSASTGRKERFNAQPRVASTPATSSKRASPPGVTLRRRIPRRRHASLDFCTEAASLSSPLAPGADSTTWFLVPPISQGSTPQLIRGDGYASPRQRGALRCAWGAETTPGG
jgi:hypothetical protein